MKTGHVSATAHIVRGRMPRRSATYGLGSGAVADGRPELADIGRLARRLMAHTVAAARAEEQSVGRLLAEHLAGDAATMPVATGSWPAYDQVNVQNGLEVWLAEAGRTHRLVELTQDRHRDFGVADLLKGSQQWGPSSAASRPGRPRRRHRRDVPAHHEPG